jgi:hypothetical protein
VSSLFVRHDLLVYALINPNNQLYEFMIKIHPRLDDVPEVAAHI